MDLSALTSLLPITVIDYFAVVVGVLTGALLAIDRKLDVVGTIALGIAAGYGGGVIRDLLLQDQGLFFMQHPLLIVACVAVCIVMSFFRKRLRNLGKYLFYFDAFSMAWFALAGASKAWFAGAGAVLSLVLGVVTAVGGGAVRDICIGETPAIFKPGTFYAISSFAGSLVYVLLEQFDVASDVASLACLVVAFGLTALSHHFGWRTSAGKSDNRR